MNRIIASFTGVWVLALFSSWATPALAVTYYVDKDHPNASDCNTGTASDPFESIQAAANIVNPGDSVAIKAAATPYFQPFGETVLCDEYGNEIGIQSFCDNNPSDPDCAKYTHEILLNRSGAAGAPITFYAHSGNVVIDPAYGGLGIRMEAVSYIIISGLEITNALVGGIVSKAASVIDPSLNLQFYDNHIYNVTSAAGHSDNVGAIKLEDCHYCTLHRNRLHDVTMPAGMNQDNGAGLFSLGLKEATLSANQIYNAPVGVLLKRGTNARGVYAHSNVFENIDLSAFLLSAQDTNAPAHVWDAIENNMFIDTRVGIQTISHETVDPSRSLTVRNNTFIRTQGIVARGMENIVFSSNHFHDISSSRPHEGFFTAADPRFYFVSVYDANRPSFLQSSNNSIFHDEFFAVLDLWSPSGSQQYNDIQSWRAATGFDTSSVEYAGTGP